MTIDQNGNRITLGIKRDEHGWQRTVWWGSGCVTNVRTYWYATRRQARGGDISHDIGEAGRVR